MENLYTTLAAHISYVIGSAISVGLTGALFYLKRKHPVKFKLLSDILRLSWETARRKKK